MQSATNRANILSMYDIDENGIIRSPGKFEGEFLYTPYFYALMLDGESIQIDNLSLDISECLDTFELEWKDFEEFPELTKSGYSIGDSISFTETSTGYYSECKRVSK